MTPGNGAGVIVGIDTGGTFTDFVVVADGAIRVYKEPSTPGNPARAVLAGLRAVEAEHAGRIVHGSTVATNALLERRGSRIALVTTAGFEDVIEIGRQTRRAIYDIDVSKDPPLVARDHRLGVVERIGPAGEVLVTLADQEIEDVVSRVVALDPAAVAVSLLHAYANPVHETRVAEALAERCHAFVTTSHDVLPEFREYERTSTTVVNAYVGPVMAGYLGELGGALDRHRVRIMQSNGGVISLDAAQRHAVQTILSGPAGGAVGGFEIARRAGFAHAITFDMGGTSTDVSLCPGEVSRTPEASVGDLPVRVPVIDIHTVGAGGGSIAYRDPGGSLRVGPRSAGADPGPICYGRGGTEVTVTDANLFLGRLSADHFLGGAATLDREAVVRAVHQFSTSLGLSPVATAEGVLKVANATMERAMRVISLERGFDPRDFSLVCFGGAGGMHAADLAKSLAIPRIIVPRAAGTLSALGMLLADVVRDYSQTVLRPTDEVVAGDLEQAFATLEGRARRDLAEEGFEAPRVTLERSADLRYVGQGFELPVPGEGDLVAAFHDRHRRRYGYADDARPTEVVNVRVRAIGETIKPELPLIAGGGDAAHATVGEQEIVFGGAAVAAPLIDRERLAQGTAFQGPALVVEYSTTTVVPPGAACRVDEHGNLILEFA